VISIDSSQGREFDIVFVSLVRSQANVGLFIRKQNRINVALTRSKHALVVIGNANALRENEFYSKLLQLHEGSIVKGVEGAR